MGKTTDIGEYKVMEACGLTPGTLVNYVDSVAEATACLIADALGISEEAAMPAARQVLEAYSQQRHIHYMQMQLDACRRGRLAADAEVERLAALLGDRANVDG